MILFKDIPEDRIVADYLGEKFNIAAAKDRVGGHNRTEMLTFTNVVNSNQLLEEVWNFYMNVGVSTWQSRDNITLYGASLFVNPDHDPSIWYKGSFGSNKFRSLSQEEYYDAPVRTEVYGGGKNDYQDIYAFRKLHPFVEDNSPGLTRFFESFNFPVCRVTARTLNGMFPIGGGYHIDTKDSFHLRFNLCLSTNGEFGLAYKDGTKVMFEPAQMHMVNSALHHSAYARSRCNFQRTNLVIDVLPWYRYDPIADGWEPNEYFGKIHPYDMVKQGIVKFGTGKHIAI